MDGDQCADRPVHAWARYVADGIVRNGVVQNVIDV
jgi:hypothetical protein